VNGIAKGARAELRCVRLLEQGGYVCTKTNGALGMFTVVAIGPDDVRAVAVRTGSTRLSKTDRAAILAIDVPDNVRRECWRFRNRRDPVIEPIGVKKAAWSPARSPVVERHTFVRESARKRAEA
jgi:hypothetical protein